MEVEEMLTRLVTRGLVPCEHNITIWQFCDGSGQFGVAVDAAELHLRTKASGASVKEALANLMIRINRGANKEAA